MFFHHRVPVNPGFDKTSLLKLLQEATDHLAQNAHRTGETLLRNLLADNHITVMILA